MGAVFVMTISEKIAAIEEVACIRKLWNCNAGWGMSFVLDVANDPENVTTYAYYRDIEQCVDEEYDVHVLKLPRRSRHEIETDFDETERQITGRSWKDCPGCGSCRIPIEQSKCQKCGGPLTNCVKCGHGRAYWTGDTCYKCGTKHNLADFEPRGTT